MSFRRRWAEFRERRRRRRDDRRELRADRKGKKHEYGADWSDQWKGGGGM